MKFTSVFKSKSFRLTMLIGLFLTSALIIMAMLLGNASGNFVVQIEDGSSEKSIAITDDPNDRTYTNILKPKGMSGMTCTTPRMFLKGDTYQEQHEALNLLSKELGRTITPETVYIYTFFIVNTGGETLPIDIEMKVNEPAGGGLSKAIRVLTYNESSEDVRIYQAVDDNPYDYQFYAYQPQSFVNDTTVFNEQTYITYAEGQPKIKYTVMFWLEGQDPEATEELYNKTIKFTLNISVANM